MFERVRRWIALVTTGVILSLVVIDPFVAQDALPPERLKLLLVFVAGMIGVQLFAQWMPQSFTISMNNDND